MEVSINYFSVLVAAVVSIIVGSLWYGPLFGKLWMSLMGISPESMEEAKKGMGKRYAAAFVGSLLTAYVIANLVLLFGVTSVSGAFSVAFWSWLGFIVPVLLGSVLWENRPNKLYILNVSYWLVSLFLVALVVTLWR